MRRSGMSWGFGVAGVVVAFALVWPHLWKVPEHDGVHAKPFVGSWDVHDLSGLRFAVFCAGIILWIWPRFTASIAGWRLALASGAASVVWAVALAGSPGIDAIWAPMAERHGYLGVAERLQPSAFLRHFVANADGYPIHVKGHPPGAPLLFHWLSAIGLGGPRWATVLVLVVWGLGVAAVLVATAEVAGTDTARRASGAVAFVPAVVWAATSADALFAGAMAVSLAAVVVASGRRDVWGDVLAVLGGAAAAFSLHLSYGLAPLLLVAVAVIAMRRRWRTAVAAAVGGAAVTAAFVAFGFWWLDGLEATRGFYHEGIALNRPYGYFTFAGNPGALAISMGPPAIGGLGIAVTGFVRGRRRRELPEHWERAILPLAVLVAVLAADLSGLSKAEVERIWLPFVPWLAAAGALVWTGIRRPTSYSQRCWLGASLALGLGIQAVLVSPW